MDKKVISVLKYLGLEEAEVKQSEYDENTFIIDGDEYLILSDEEANEAHREYIASFIDDVGVAGFTKVAQEYIFENCMDYTWFDLVMKESFEAYIDNIRCEESAVLNEGSSNGEFKSRLVAEMYDAGCQDEASYLEYLCSDYENGIQWYKENFGDEDFSKMANKYCNIDIDKISEYCIEYDGRGHSLASYDGNEIELDDGYYAYKIS